MDQMIQQAFPILHLALLLLQRRRGRLRLSALALDRGVHNRVDKSVNHLHLLQHFVIPELRKRPVWAEARAHRNHTLCLVERLGEPVRRHVVRERVDAARVVRIRDARAERAHVLTKEEVRRGVHREARREVLDVDGVALAQARLQLAERVSRVALEDIEVTDAVFAEKRAGHGAMESDP